MPTLERADNGGVMATGDWHRWFAWRPVWMVDRGWLWLITVERQFSRLTRANGVTTYVRELRPTRAVSPDAPRTDDGRGR